MLGKSTTRAEGCALRNIISELRRRKVPHTAGVYLAAAWGATEILDFLINRIPVFPPWLGTVIAILFVLGFPVTVFLAWLFDFGPGGMRRAQPGSPVGTLAIAGSLVLLAAMTAALSVWTIPRTGSRTRTAAPGAGLAASGPSVAVLPCENRGSREADAYLVDGIYDDLITHIARIGAIKTISRRTMEHYRNVDRPVPDIAREVGSATVMTCAVQRAAQRLRINVQLIDAGSDVSLWAQTYDRQLDSSQIFAVQSEIAGAVASHLKAALSPADGMGLAREPTANFAAYEAYLMGRQRQFKRSSASLEQAVTYFQKAVELDPKYALAYAGLADTYMLLGDYGDLSLKEMLAAAEPPVQKALRLDSTLAPAHATLGAILTKAGNYVGAEAAFRRAIKLDPNFATAYHWYGDLLLSYAGRPEAALPLLGRARELDPLSPIVIITQGEALEAIGGVDDALAAYRKAIEIEPDFPLAYLLVSQLHHFWRGRLDEAVRWGREMVAVDPGNASGCTALALDYLDLGDGDEAERWIERAFALGPGRFFANNAAAFLYRYQGREEEALATARFLQSIAPGNNTSLITYVSFGRHAEALRLFADSHPELDCDGTPDVDRSNFLPALNLSLAREKTGETDCAKRLLREVLEQFEHMPRLGLRGYGIADVEIYARLGQRRLALDTLRRAVDGGWRALWWAQGERSPHLESLRADPEFKALMNEIRVEMARQLERVRELDRRGELAPVPALPVSSP